MQLRKKEKRSEERERIKQEEVMETYDGPDWV